MVQTTDVASHLTIEQLDAGLDHIRRSPADSGTLLMIVRRPDVDKREIVAEGILDVDDGLAGDTWHVRGEREYPGRQPQP